MGLAAKGSRVGTFYIAARHFTYVMIAMYSFFTKRENSVNLIGRIKVISHYPTDSVVKFNITEMAAILANEGIRLNPLFSPPDVLLAFLLHL